MFLLLRKFGADWDAVDNDGFTALERALQGNHFNAVHSETSVGKQRS